MIFRKHPVDEIPDGALLAHSDPLAGLKKGLALDETGRAALKQAGRGEVTVAILESGDVLENDVATQLATTLCGTGLTARPAHTGRVNLHATRAGVLTYDVAALTAANSHHEGITIATAPPMSALGAGDMAATIKIIPYSLPQSVMDSFSSPPLAVAPFLGKTAALISTGDDPNWPRTRAILQDRLTRVGIEIGYEDRTPHAVAPLAKAISDAAAQGVELFLIWGAAAIVDRRDVVPAALVQAGGLIERFGMPVDPGNLLMLGRMGVSPVIGIPGCGRSPKRNGLDLVLERLAADLDVTPGDIAAMGVGGLMPDIAARPSPRTRRESAKIGALILGAGQSRRMGDANKLTLPFNGKPMIAHVAEATLASQCARTVVVTGHDSDAVAAVLPDGVATIHNPDFETGMASSIRTGIAELSDMDGVLILLGDMPLVTAAHLDRLIDTFATTAAQALVPVMGGKRGNPVLFAQSQFGALARLTGDQGAKALLSQIDCLEVDLGDGRAVLADADDAASLAALSSG